MNLKPLFLSVVLQMSLLALGVDLKASFVAGAVFSSAIFLQSARDFESLASSLNDKGTKASAPAQIVGKSGVKHEFALAAMGDGGTTKVVVDTELSVGEVDEMRVLKFYVKVYDVSPEKAILCVSPGLSERGKTLAKEYGISILENEVPRKLVPMAAEEVNKLMERA